MVKWVARLAIIAALLGLVGTIVIIFYLGGRTHKEALRNKPKKEARADSVIDSPLLHPVPKIAETLPVSKPRVIIKKEDRVKAVTPSKPKIEETPITQTPPKAEPKHTVKEVEENPVIPAPRKAEPKPTVKKAEEKPKPKKEKELTKEREEKLFTVAELQQVVTRINKANQGKPGYSRCVQLFSTAETSNSRTISQIETYLRSQGFSIAGRETISKKVQGIQITPAGGCTRVTVGSF